jgi:hypothetical protein
MNLPRSTYYYKSTSRPDGEKALIARIEAVISEFPGFSVHNFCRQKYA